MIIQEFCEMVKSSRAKNYDNAKMFWREKSISCTYAYYSKVEKNTVPEISIALELIDKLGLNRRKALYAWVRDQMPNNELKAEFSEIDDRPRFSAEQRSDQSCVVNRMQTKLLIKNPVYWEILLYFSTATSKFVPTVATVSKEFNMTQSQTKKMLEELYDYALLDKNSDGQYESKKWMFIPYEDEFKPLRDLNFRRAVGQFAKADPDYQFRTTITCCLLPRHQRIIESKFISLSNELIDLAQTEDTKDTIPFTVGIYSSPRIFGND